MAADKVGGRHAEVDDTEAGASVKLGELLLGSGETDAQSLDFAEPALAFGFGDAGGEVVADVDQPCSLSRIRSEERASDTSVLMNARCSEGACAGTDGNLPFLEVGEESVPFFVGGGSVPSLGRAARRRAMNARWASIVSVVLQPVPGAETASGIDQGAIGGDP
ncbi:hypothetical protein ACFY8S_38870 [Streptomyces hygroscopicus]|uniref:hypothetical protein n=1 Tax=Streptomyces hygroscopicus TaxID=1912 RepID=UPI003673A0A5